MGFSVEEAVALQGRYTLGFVDPVVSTPGIRNRCTMNPYVFDNSYFSEILLENKSKYYKTQLCKDLVSSSETKEFVKNFSEDQNKFFAVFARAFKRQSELGHEEFMMGEVEDCEVLEDIYEIETGEFTKPSEITNEQDKLLQGLQSHIAKA